MDAPLLLKPGDPSPVDGIYDEVDTIGRPSGRHVSVRKDERLPDSLHGYKWRLRQESAT